MNSYTDNFKKGVLLVLLVILAAMLFSNTAHAQSTTVNQTVLGSGNAVDGTVEVTPVMDGMFFVPQYMPGHPTAATIYPRVVDVNCTKGDKVLNCEGYNWAPSMGRGEYLFIRPHMVKKLDPAAPVVVYKEVPVVVYKEVPAKKVSE